MLLKPSLRETKMENCRNHPLLKHPRSRSFGALRANSARFDGIPAGDPGKQPTSNLLRGDLPREELPSSLKKTLPLHFQRRSAFQTEKLCRFAFIPARFLHGFFNVMATHLVKDIIQVEITAERKRHCLDSTQHTPRLSANRCHSLLKTQKWSGSLPTASL